MEELDEILEMAFVGLYMRDPNGDFVSLDDKRGVLKDHLKAEIEAYANKQVVDLIKTVGEMYPVDVFTPATSADLAAVKGLENGANIVTRLHCDGIRHGLKMIQRELSSSVALPPPDHSRGSNGSTKPNDPSVAEEEK